MTETEELIEYLKGTCNSLDVGCAVCLLDIDDIDYEKLDEEIFCCEECSWWCTVDESSHSEANICIDCNPEDPWYEEGEEGE